MHNKGQAIAVDLVIAVALFLVVLSALMAIWNNQNAMAQKQLILQDMKSVGTRTLDYMVKSPGETTTGTTSWEVCPACVIPQDWLVHLENNVKFIGLAEHDRVLKQEKVEAFCGIKTGEGHFSGGYANDNPDETKEKILMNYDYFFRLSKINVITDEPPEFELEEIKKCGRLPSSLAGTLKEVAAQVNIKRIVNYQYQEGGVEKNSEALAELIVYYTKDYS